MFFRSTVATLGVLFAVAVAGTLVIAVLPLGGENERWMLHTNVAAVVRNGADYYNRSATSPASTTAAGWSAPAQSRLSLCGRRRLPRPCCWLSPPRPRLVTFRRRDVP